MLLYDQHGALLISLILTVTVMAVLGAAMVTLTSSSSQGFLVSTSSRKAYYLAYSGLSYYDAQPVKPGLPQTYRLANGDRIVLDVEGFPQRLTATGVVAGPFGDTRFKLVARGTGGTPEWVDTMENTANWQSDALAPGRYDTAPIDGNAALRTTGETFDLPGVGGEAPLQTTIDAAAALREDYENQRRSADPLSLEWLRADFYARYWSAVAGALEDARAVLDGAGIGNTALTLPREFFQPRVFGVFDWRAADAGNAIPFLTYWKEAVYDGVSHTPKSLSYDVQVKTAVLPDAGDYLGGISLRLDDSVVNGGNLLGLSIVRGRRGAMLPDRLVPEDDAATPSIILWSQRDRNGDGLITPSWEYTVPPAGPTLTLWPEEREILAHAALPLNYCLLRDSTVYFQPWLTLLVRVEERTVSAAEAGGGFVAGDRVNAIKVFVATPSQCNGGGSTSGAAADLMLDNRRGSNPRLAPLSPLANWPVFDRMNFTATNDDFSLLGGDPTRIDWTFVSPSPSPVMGFRIAKAGRSNEWEADAVLLTDAFTTEGYSEDEENWPAELGLHAMGLPGETPAAVYFDDFAVRLKGRDPRPR